MADKVGKLAYWFYVMRGRKEGDALTDWVRAERVFVTMDRIKSGTEKFAVTARKLLWKFLKYPLVVMLAGLAIWVFQRQYIKSGEVLRNKFEIMRAAPSIYAAYYQETWNQWYAFRNRQPSEEYRRNIQRIAAEAKTIEVQLPVLFRDKQIYEKWRQVMRILWEANYPVGREDVTEQQLNAKLKVAGQLIDDILNSMYKELR